MKNFVRNCLNVFPSFGIIVRPLFPAQKFIPNVSETLRKRAIFESFGTVYFYEPGSAYQIEASGVFQCQVARQLALVDARDPQSGQRVYQGQRDGATAAADVHDTQVFVGFSH
jgi:hypothetical protein